MTKEQLATLERLARAATPGEWRIGGCGRNRWIAAGDEWIAHFSTAGSPAAADADAAYIAAAHPGRMLALIAAVRRRQPDKGWTPEHDDKHTGGLLLHAPWGAAARISRSVSLPLSDPRRRKLLVQAAALIFAEIERLDRAASRKEMRA